MRCTVNKLIRGGTHSFVMQLVQMRGGTQYNNAACVDDIEPVQIKGGTWYNIICYAACVDDVELVQMRGVGLRRLCQHNFRNNRPDAASGIIRE